MSEARMEARGVTVDHATVHRRVITESPQLAKAFHRRKRPVWIGWRMDEMSIKVKGEWHSLARAVDTTGQTIDCLLTEQRDEPAATRCLTKAMRRHGVPEKITIDGDTANGSGSPERQCGARHRHRHPQNHVSQQHC